MTKFYRVIKDTFIWEKGAILKSDFEGKLYEAISDIWYTNDLMGMSCNKSVQAYVIEKSPLWFERVYEVNNGSKIIYTVKEEAKRLFEE